MEEAPAPGTSSIFSFANKSLFEIKKLLTTSISDAPLFLRICHFFCKFVVGNQVNSKEQYGF
jgi:hypothetical protein